MTGEPFAATADRLLRRIEDARQLGDHTAERAAVAELLNAYTRLGDREIGTEEEQTAYLLSLHLGQLPLRLQQAGIRLADLPKPAIAHQTTDAVADELPPDARHRVSSLLSTVRDLTPRVIVASLARFYVEHRPQDGVYWDGVPQPFAVIDARDGKPVGYHETRGRAQQNAALADQARRHAEGHDEVM